MAKRARRAKGGKPAPEPASAAVALAEPPPKPEPAPAATPGPAPESQPQPNAPSRAWSNALIALFLLFQIAMPLRYYLGERGYDERFSWRMFSTLRMQRCKVRVREDVLEGGATTTRDLNLGRTLHVAWIGMLERYRPQVVEKLLHKRCAEPAVRAVRYSRTCRDTDGKALPELEVALDCASSALTQRTLPR